MNALTLPSHCSTHALVSTLTENEVFSSAWDKLPLIFPDKCHVTTGAMAFLCSWGLELQRTGNGTQLQFRTNLMHRLVYSGAVDLSDGVETFQDYADKNGLVVGDRGGVMRIDYVNGFIAVTFRDPPPAGRGIMCGYWYQP